MMKKKELLIMLDLKLNLMVFQILEKIVGNGSLIRPKRIYTCVYVSLQ
jgi:hypothetical protein